MLADGELFKIIQGDCIQEMASMQRESIDFSVYSPPVFPKVYAYTSSSADLGNSEDLYGEAPLHFSFFFRAIRPLLKPGRVMVVHCQQIVKMKRSGDQRLIDFRGMLIRLAERAGFVYDYDWLIRKNPQKQAIRNKAWELKFQGLENDRARSLGALGDYLIKFLAPGTNAVPIDDSESVTRNNWIDWAENCWDDIRENDTLNLKSSKVAGDTQHICPLQLSVSERLVRMYSKPGEIILSPFAGIGSEGVSALRLGRRFVGVELRPEWKDRAERECVLAVKQFSESKKTLFDAIA